MNDADVKVIVVKRLQIEHDIALRNVCGNLNFVVTWWPLYMSYFALPILFDADTWYRSSLEMSAFDRCRLKQHLRQKFGVRHVFSINSVDNSVKVNKLLLTQYI